MDCYHINEDLLERFSMGKLEEPLLSHFEDHYFVCSPCQDRIRQLDAYHLAIRAVAARPDPVPFWQRVRSVLTQPVLRPLLPVAAVACVVIFTFVPNNSRAHQTVLLTSERGAPAGSALHSSNLTLALDLRGLENRTKLFTEVADGNGIAVWSGVALPSGTQATVAVSRRLSGGRYWVRVYGDSSRQDLLREYGLTVE